MNLLDKFLNNILRLGFWTDLINFFYIRKCFKILAADYPNYDKSIELKISPLSVLFTEIEFDANIEEKMHPVVLSAKLEKVNMSLMSMNLDGLIETEVIRLIPYDDQGLMKERYIAKFIPYMRNVTVFNAIYWSVVFFIAYRLIVKYHTPIFDFLNGIYQFIF